jgi:hypothetical protein
LAAGSHEELALSHGRASRNSLDSFLAWRLCVVNDIGLCLMLSIALLRNAYENMQGGASNEMVCRFFNAAP